MKTLFDALEEAESSELPAEVQELAAQVEHHDRLYWEQSAPEIPDAEYDRLVERLRSLAPQHPVLRRIGGGGGPASGESWRHRTPMLSLGKCYDEDGLRRWLDKVSGPVIESPKVDGVAASLIYDDRGRLVVGATRGNGLEGEVATAQLRRVQGIPLQIPSGGVALEARGEVYLPLSRFEELSDRFSNPRNATAGALKQKDPARTAELGLRFVAYSLLGTDALRERDRLAHLERLGFEPVQHQILDRDEVQRSYETWLTRRLELDYEIDGVVYEIDDVPQQRALGSTAHHPRWAMAYKLPSEARPARLQEVIWSVSRTGTLTPVARISPTQLSGAVVSRVSLHNAGMLAKLGITEGALLQVVRRGGVIPKVEAVLEASGDPVPFPTECPSCGAAVERDGDFLLCPARATCPAQRLGVLEHYLKALGIDGFGPALLEQLVERGLLATPADLYGLTVEGLLPLERMGETLAAKLVANIQGARSVALGTLLVALGIRELGPQVARELEARYASLDALSAATPEELAEIPGIGPVIARHVVEGLVSRRPLVERLLDHLDVVQPEAPEAPGALPLAGESFVFTGSMAKLKRAEAQERVRSLGGETPSGLRQDTTYLIVGDRGSPLFGAGKKGSKLRRAEALQAKGAALRIISETEFLERIEGLER